jgi:hypothetical protein
MTARILGDEFKTESLEVFALPQAGHGGPNSLSHFIDSLSFFLFGDSGA